MKLAIEIKNATKTYKEFVLDNVSFCVPEGTIMGFIGGNGAGKSTTIKIILDLIRSESGEINVFGESNLSQKGQWKEDVGVVLDESSFPESLKLKHINGIMKKAYKNWNPSTFQHYCEKFDLSPKKMVKEYSRGMKMKLSIAVALSHSAKLLILDEATSGLDPMVRDEILDIFLEFMEQENHSILLSSHITTDLEKICDYITFIHKGNILFTQRKDDLLETYGMLKCSTEDFSKIDPAIVRGYRKNQFGVEALILKNQYWGGCVVDSATIEDIMLYYVKENNYELLNH